MYLCSPSATRRRVSGLLSEGLRTVRQQQVTCAHMIGTDSRTEIYSEVWTWTFENATNTFGVADLNSLSGTESDAIQLWSYGFLGLLDPTGGNATST